MRFLSLISLLIALQVSGQKRYPSLLSLQAPLTPALETESNDSPENELFTEIIDERTLTSASFRSPSGLVKKVFSSKPLHYMSRKGNLEPINPYLRYTTSGRWEAREQPFPTSLDEKGQFQLTSSNGTQLLFGKILVINGLNPNLSDKFIDSTGIEFHNVIPGVDKQVWFMENAVKYAYILTNEYGQYPDDFVAVEEISIPDHLEIVRTSDANPEMTAIADWMIIDKTTGKIEGRIGVPICWDGAGKSTIGQCSVKRDGDHYQIEVRLNGDWIHAGDRAFPIVVDPLVAGPLSSWNNGNMPSCFMPSFNKDSLLVTIPGGISLTHVIVGGSFYADPFTGATMSMGSMYFSTSCASSTYFTVTGANANIAGTAYLDSFNLLNPLSCCFPKLCNDTSVYVYFHLGRNSLGSGCNTTYIRYDQATTQWPFKVIMYGRTPEAYGSEWNVPQTAICANECTFTATGYARYGVPPYTFTHPWTTDVVIDGDNIGCNSGATNHIFTLTNPNCPIYCDESYTSLSVPPPVITDACGTVIQNIPFKTKPILPASEPIAVYDSIICQGDPVTVNLSACLDGGQSYYIGNGINGTGSFTQPVANETGSVLTVQYDMYATLGNCTSDTQQIYLYIIPEMIGNFNIIDNPTIVDMPFTIEDVTNPPASVITNWSWYLQDSLISTTESFDGSMAEPGEYPLCMVVNDNFGCQDSVCQVLQIVPASIDNINIITPNDDGINDVLYFEYLDSYPDNEIFIFNRWGNLLYSQKNYQNDWSGVEYTDGTYFYLLKVHEIGKEYSSFFQIKK
jgi:gliding motility-associated-like protein